MDFQTVCADEKVIPRSKGIVSRDPSNLLIVDDERAIRTVLRTVLGDCGFSIVEASRGDKALALAHAAQFDAVLLDINLPDINGIEVCRMMRESWPRLPIIMLTVRDAEDSKVEALESGADDYVTKPFHIGELIARVRLAIRRNQNYEEHEQEAIVIGDVFLDPARHEVKKKGRAVHLTPKQFELLHYLMARAGRPILHAKLLRSIWGAEYGSQVEYLRTFIRQIRVKIEDDPAHPRYLLTDSHIGYRFTEGRQESF
jgi:two-component system, OmpR family, KDP operon response regulator KdpE